MSHMEGHAASLNQTAFFATLHCLTGCAIGEVVGMVITTALGWSNFSSIFVSIILAFAFGYSFTLWPLLRAGMTFGAAAALAFASDTVSITVMEIVDNAVIIFIPDALNANLNDFLFWWSLGLSLILAGLAAFPVNRWLISRHKGHALVHDQHGHDDHHDHRRH